jgi:drug/metabolite transporter (DMT)-like permease
VKTASLKLITAVVLWGMTIVPTKWALETIPPFTLMVMRLFAASLIFLPYAWIKTRKTARSVRIRWGRMSVLSFTGVAGYFLFNSAGVSLTSGVNASIIFAALPLFTLLLAAFYLKERISAAQWFGLALGTTGVVMITVQPQSLNNHSLLGDLLVLASMLVFAIYVIQMKRPQEEAALPSELFTALTIFIGGLMILPFAAVETWLHGWPTLTTKALVSVLLLTFGSTILAYWMWNKGLESTTAAKAGIYLNTMPLISVLSSIFLLGEELTWRTVAGGLFVLFGVYWAERRKELEPQVAVPAE